MPMSISYILTVAIVIIMIIVEAAVVVVVVKGGGVKIIMFIFRLSLFKDGEFSKPSRSVVNQ